MWAYISPELLKAIEGELEEEVVPELMDSFAKVTCFYILYICEGASLLRSFLDSFCLAEFILLHFSIPFYILFVSY